MDAITAIVIDDDLDSVESITDWIESRGIKVIGKGRDGKDAIDLYEKLRPKISLLDIMMPRYDGFYAAEAIRAIEPNSRIIMVTADTAHETEIKLEKLKLDHVYKPYDIDDIMDHIGKQLDSTRMTQSPPRPSSPPARPSVLQDDAHPTPPSFQEYGVTGRGYVQDEALFENYPFRF